MYFITTKRMLEVCFSAHPNIQYRTLFYFTCLLRREPSVLFTSTLLQIKSINLLQRLSLPLQYLILIPAPVQLMNILRHSFLLPR